MFAVDWTDPLLYDLVVDTETIGVRTAVVQGLGLIAGAGAGVGAPADRLRLARVVESETAGRRSAR